MPKIKAVAIEEIWITGLAPVVSPPNFKDKPPIPAIKIELTTNRFLDSPRSIPLSMFKPETAMKPYKDKQTPPITQLGIVSIKATMGEQNAKTIAMTDAPRIDKTEAFLVIATQPTDSP